MPTGQALPLTFNLFNLFVFNVGLFFWRHDIQNNATKKNDIRHVSFNNMVHGMTVLKL
jgi:hypothetical protein